MNMAVAWHTLDTAVYSLLSVTFSYIMTVSKTYIGWKVTYYVAQKYVQFLHRMKRSKHNDEK